MRNTIKLILFSILLSWKPLYSQTGSDIIFCLDNSGSISDVAFNQMTVSTMKLMEQVLKCNRDNRVSVVHYGTDYMDMSPSLPRIYIESNFTSDLATAQAFSRRLKNGDHFHDAVNLIGAALDHYPHPDIVSPQKTLDKHRERPLVIVLFSDAERANGNLSSGSYLVNFNPPNGLHEDNAFATFTKFKMDRNAKFIVVHVSDYSPYIEAAANIASRGGSYNGPIEQYNDDPDHNLLPRFYLNKTNFTLTNTEIAELSNSICKMNTAYVDFTYQTRSCKEPMGFPLHVNGNYAIPQGASIVNFQLSLLDIATSAVYPTSAAVNFPNPNEFEFTVNQADLTNPPSGQYKFIIEFVYSLGGNNDGVHAENSINSSYDFMYCENLRTNTNISNPAAKFAKPKDKEYHIDLNADPNNTKSMLKEKVQQKNIQVSPNPNDGVFIVSLDKVRSGSLHINDINGKVVFEKTFSNEKEIAVDIHSLPSNTYIVKVNSGNEVFTQKMIKR
ncbi:T9SS type A sorting domain-containing protein [Chryseobacterium jejuense]|uniref:T9SS type A sorting domain-containing protein n=1 Tax=Chryseobacterium jejuense TaxID=445960 RepID=UPI001AEA8C43|nr:T9SS type A sorting domain-containing protein [Chryseobacterium jejuense]MBP2618617.1 hypothetical protein [Chryseobacterium jejuense]